MRRFSVGYKLLPEASECFADIVRDYQDQIREVYFAWPGEPSGRAPVEPEGITRLQTELQRIKSWGIKLQLLFNASCYGGQALSRELADHAVAIVKQLMDTTGLDAITTMSPLIAGAVKKHFPAIDIRASVNMRLGTVAGMSYVKDIYQSYTLQREYNRDPERLAELQAWAEASGKQLHVLANSGCLNFCAFQTFHDNVVAHETAVNSHDNVPGIATLCRAWYARKEHWPGFLQGSWIRPEDIEQHGRFFRGGYKLATRMHDNPRLVIDAYARGKFHGNLPDLMEPGFGPAFYPQVMINDRFPEDWFDRTMHCHKQCGACTYCRKILAGLQVNIGDA
ncbi:MAG: hypothetical protein PHW60_03145 [Kiritimatiellae bacterium]|nr:hypothetical protein [Kiritimatiellia bacterium]